ncbi:MAG: hypothetical protein Q9195_008330 [Heterodermia aff. obscurata]
MSAPLDQDAPIAATDSSIISPDNNVLTVPDTWFSDRTPKWNEAIKQWSQDPKTKHQWLELRKLILDALEPGKDTAEPLVERAEFLTEVQPETKPSGKWRLRLKRCEPILNAAKGFVMPLANLDPHKIAPIACASVFFGFNIIFNRMSPENREKMLDLLFSCGDTIRECLSFEMHFSASTHSAIAKDVPAVEAALPNLYLAALGLMYDIQHGCRDVKREYDSKREEWSDWVKVRGRIFLNELIDKAVVWDRQEKEIKRQKDTWMSMKKNLEAKLQKDKDNVNTLEWLRKDGDPEPTLASIKSTVTTDDYYQLTGNWLLSGPEFTTWAETFEPTATQSIAKRVLWLRGSYGTGKTTLLYQALVALEQRPEFRPASKNLRLIRYFCDASATPSTPPDYETIVRAMVRRLSRLPNYSIAKPAEAFYKDKTGSRGQDREPGIREWEELFKTLVHTRAEKDHFIFLIDALDECSENSVWRKLLGLLCDIMKSCPNVSFLCSSHHHVLVDMYFGNQNQVFRADTDEFGANILEEIELTPTMTKAEMETFIVGEVNRRKKYAGKSVFYQLDQTALLEELIQTLKDNANGMFKWIEVWLGILIATDDELLEIRDPDDAKQLFKEIRDETEDYKDDLHKKLQRGYQRLWDQNNLRDPKKVRIRLFHLVLGSFKAQTLETVTQALKIRSNSYDEHLTPEHVKRLYSNFLHEVAPKSSLREAIYPNYYGLEVELRFVHNSARKFILNMTANQGSGREGEDEKQFSDKANHLSIANLYVETIGSCTHPYWQAMGLEPANWRHLGTNTPQAKRLYQDIGKFQAPHYQGTAVLSTGKFPFYFYLAQYGMDHYAYAAKATKTSVLDPLSPWNDVIDRILLSPTSALGFFLMATGCVSGVRMSIKGWRSLGPKEVRNSVKGERFLRKTNGLVELLPSHVLARLQVFSENDIDRIQNAPEELDKIFQRGILQHAADVGGTLPKYPGSPFNTGSQGTAMHHGCESDNVPFVRLLLVAAKAKPNEAIGGILHKTVDDFAPFSTAINNSAIDTAQVLLSESRTRKQESRARTVAEPPAEQYTSALWSLLSYPVNIPSTRWPVLHFMVMLEMERELCRLLAVAQPEDIDLRDHSGCTVLHKAATVDLVALASDLVENYGADIEATNSEGCTPAYLAWKNNSRKALTYLRGHEARIADTEADWRSILLDQTTGAK